ncbi:MAG: FtsX-like permease family protein [Myxococcota bacterium]|nr:FtsX-like permease family protein [Myxococcota bacterium]
MIGRLAIILMPLVTGGLLALGLHLASGQTNLYGDRMAAAAALWLVLSGLLVGVFARLLATELTHRSLAILFSILVIVGTAIPNMSSTDPVFYELIGGHYGVVSLTLGCLLFTLASTTSAAILHLLKSGGSWGWSLRLSRAFLASRRRDTSVNIITLIAVGGVTMAVCSLIVVLSVMSGFESDLRSKILGANPHLMVFKSGDAFTNWPEVKEKVSAIEGVQSAVPFLFSKVMITSPTNMDMALLRGVPARDKASFGKLADAMIHGDYKHLADPSKIPDPMAEFDIDMPESKDPFSPGAEGAKGDIGHDSFLDDPEVPMEPLTSQLPGIVLGAELALMLHVSEGQEVNVITASQEDLGPDGIVPRSRSYRVAGIFRTGYYDADAQIAILDLPEMQSLLDVQGITGLELRVDDLDNVARVGTACMESLGWFPYRTRDWRQNHRPLLQALRLEKIMMFLLLCAAVLVAALNIVSILVMIVLERGKEIAILKSMGATDTGVMRVFVAYGLIVGSAGTLLGALLGVLLCLALGQLGLGIAAEVYYIDRLPVELRSAEVVTVMVATMVICFLATLFPAWRAARMRPVDGLRHD